MQKGQEHTPVKTGKRKEVIKSGYYQIDIAAM